MKNYPKGFVELSYYHNKYIIKNWTKLSYYLEIV